MSRLSELRSTGGLRGMQILHPEKCYRQYIGVIVGNRKLIYVNAFCNIEPYNWRERFVNICDGGWSVWGALFDPTTGEFSELATNRVVESASLS